MRSLSGLKLISKKAVGGRALLVVDIDHYDGWTDEKINSDKQFLEIVTSIHEKILWARKSGIPVIFIMLEPVPKLTSQLTIKEGHSCAGCDRRKNKLSSFLGHNHSPFEPIFIKEENDAFTNKELRPYLMRIGVRELLLAGCNTPFCICETARGAVKAGFHVKLLEDAVFPPFDNRYKKRQWIDSVQSISSYPRIRVTITIGRAED